MNFLYYLTCFESYNEKSPLIILIAIWTTRISSLLHLLLLFLDPFTEFLLNRLIYPALKHCFSAFSFAALCRSQVFLQLQKLLELTHIRSELIFVQVKDTVDLDLGTLLIWTVFRNLEQIIYNGLKRSIDNVCYRLDKVLSHCFVKTLKLRKDFRIVHSYQIYLLFFQMQDQVTFS